MTVGEPRLLKTTHTLLRVVKEAQLVPQLTTRVAEIVHLLSARDLVGVLLPMHRYIQAAPPAPAQFSLLSPHDGVSGDMSDAEWTREFPASATIHARELTDAFRDVCVARMKGEVGIVFRTAFPAEP